MAKVAEAVATGMRDNNQTSIGWGDGCVLDYAGELVNVKIPHPLNRMRAVFAHLERSPLFEKRYRRSIDSSAREQRVRVFVLATTPKAGS